MLLLITKYQKLEIMFDTYNILKSYKGNSVHGRSCLNKTGDVLCLHGAFKKTLKTSLYNGMKKETEILLTLIVKTGTGFLNPFAFGLPGGFLFWKEYAIIILKVRTHCMNRWSGAEALPFHLTGKHIQIDAWPIISKTGM